MGSRTTFRRIIVITMKFALGRGTRRIINHIKRLGTMAHPSAGGGGDDLCAQRQIFNVIRSLMILAMRSYCPLRSRPFVSLCRCGGVDAKLAWPVHAYIYQPLTWQPLSIRRSTVWVRTQARKGGRHWGTEWWSVYEFTHIQLLREFMARSDWVSRKGGVPHRTGRSTTY